MVVSQFFRVWIGQPCLKASVEVHDAVRSVYLSHLMLLMDRLMMSWLLIGLTDLTGLTVQVPAEV